MERASQPAAETPPPAEAPPAGDPKKATGSLRALAVLLVFVLAFGAAVMFVAGGDVADWANLDDPPEEQASAPEIFDGGETKQNVTVALMYASGAIGAIAAVLALLVAVTGRFVRPFAIAAIVAVIVAAIALLM